MWHETQTIANWFWIIIVLGNPESYSQKVFLQKKQSFSSFILIPVKNIFIIKWLQKEFIWAEKK